MNNNTYLVAAFLGLLAVLGPRPASAQENEAARARRILDDAQAHEQGQRYAIAAQRYLELYEVMREAELPRAPVALWSAGFCLSRVPGREREARETLRRFLEASTALAQQASDIQGYRSESVSIIGELEARRPTGEDLDRPASSTDSTAADGGSISPVGPVILGVAGGTLLAGAIVGAISLDQGSDFSGACDDLSACPPALRPQYDEMRTLSAIADVLLVAGGITAALGLVLTLAVTDGEDAAMTATCGPHGCQAIAWGRF